MGNIAHFDLAFNADSSEGVASNVVTSYTTPVISTRNAGRRAKNDNLVATNIALQNYFNARETAHKVIGYGYILLVAIICLSSSIFIPRAGFLGASIITTGWIGVNTLAYLAKAWQPGQGWIRGDGGPSEPGFVGTLWDEYLRCKRANDVVVNQSVIVDGVVFALEPSDFVTCQRLAHIPEAEASVLKSTALVHYTSARNAACLHLRFAICFMFALSFLILSAALPLAGPLGALVLYQYWTVVRADSGLFDGSGKRFEPGFVKTLRERYEHLDRDWEAEDGNESFAASRSDGEGRGTPSLSRSTSTSTLGASEPSTPPMKQSASYESVRKVASC